MKVNATPLILAFTLATLCFSSRTSSAFYSPNTGRWLSRDPARETGGNNLFELIGNNAVNDVDPVGLFWGMGHDRLIDNAFGNLWDSTHYLATGLRDILRRASRTVDRYFQAPEFSYMHAMRDKIQNQSKEEAERKAKNWVIGQLFEAADETSGGNPDGGLWALGMGMHTIMDAYSPEHSDFKPWGGLSGLANLGSAAGHTIKEYFHSLNKHVDNLKGTSDEMQSYYDAYKLLAE